LRKRRYGKVGARDREVSPETVDEKRRSASTPGPFVARHPPRFAASQQSDLADRALLAGSVYSRARRTGKNPARTGNATPAWASAETVSVTTGHTIDASGRNSSAYRSVRTRRFQSRPPKWARDCRSATLRYCLQARADRRDARVRSRWSSRRRPACEPTRAQTGTQDHRRPPMALVPYWTDVPMGRSRGRRVGIGTLYRDFPTHRADQGGQLGQLTRSPSLAARLRPHEPDRRAMTPCCTP